MFNSNSFHFPAEEKMECIRCKICRFNIKILLDHSTFLRELAAQKSAGQQNNACVVFVTGAFFYLLLHVYVFVCMFTLLFTTQLLMYTCIHFCKHIGFLIKKSEVPQLAELLIFLLGACPLIKL
ncbi:hypothetical protein AU377_07785 [Sporosarcina sp. HYO08]|nr:hypothetical protein AU377_07785 [Sporosarcina sp. HYO08]